VTKDDIKILVFRRFIRNECHNAYLNLSHMLHSYLYSKDAMMYKTIMRQ